MDNKKQPPEIPSLREQLSEMERERDVALVKARVAHLQVETFKKAYNDLAVIVSEKNVENARLKAGYVQGLYHMGLIALIAMAIVWLATMAHYTSPVAAPPTPEQQLEDTLKISDKLPVMYGHIVMDPFGGETFVTDTIGLKMPSLTTYDPATGQLYMMDIGLNDWAKEDHDQQHKDYFRVQGLVDSLLATGFPADKIKAL